MRIIRILSAHLLYIICPKISRHKSKENRRKEKKRNLPFYRVYALCYDSFNLKIERQDNNYEYSI